MRRFLACALLAVGSVCGAGAARADVVTDWNATAVTAVQALGASTPIQSRALAIVHGNSLERRGARRAGGPECQPARQR